MGNKKIQAYLVLEDSDSEESLNLGCGFKIGGKVRVLKRNGARQGRTDLGEGILVGITERFKVKLNSDGKIHSFPFEEVFLPNKA
jgi:hypothetical protein